MRAQLERLADADDQFAEVFLSAGSPDVVPADAVVAAVRRVTLSQSTRGGYIAVLCGSAYKNKARLAVNDVDFTNSVARRCFWRRVCNHCLMR